MQSKMVIDIRSDETRIDIGGFRISAHVTPVEGRYRVSFQDPFKAKAEPAETYDDFLAALTAASRELAERASVKGVELSVPHPFGA